MKMTCAVIGDLLPLYADGLASEDSAALVREHLETCHDCRERLELMRRDSAPAREDGAPLEKLKKEIRRRRLRTAAMAALLVFALLFALLGRMTGGDPIPYSPDLLQVKGMESAGPEASGYRPEGWQSAYPDQALVLERNERVTGVASEYALDEETGELTVFLQYFGARSVLSSDGLMFLEGDGVRDILAPVPDRVIYGFGADQTLLWGEPMSGGVAVLPRLALAYYALIAIGLAAALGLGWLAVRKKKAAGVLRQLWLAPVSWLLGQLLIRGTETTSVFLARDMGMIGVEALAIYALLTLTLAARREKKNDK